jgi:hypothetical protein
LEIKQILSIIGLIGIFGCNTGSKSAEKKAQAFQLSTSIDSLGRFIDLSVYRPKSVKWTVKTLGIADSRVPGPSDYNLQAIMTFDSLSIRAIKRDYSFLSIHFTPKDINKFTFDWLPQGYIFEEDVGDAVTYQPFCFKSNLYVTGGFIINQNDILLSFNTQ